MGKVCEQNDEATYRSFGGAQSSERLCPGAVLVSRNGAHEPCQVLQIELHRLELSRNVFRVLRCVLEGLDIPDRLAGEFKEARDGGDDS